MYFEIKPTYVGITRDNIEKTRPLLKEWKKVNESFLEESYKGNKVAYYYENIKTGDVFTYNSEVCFYAASSIKILVCLMMFEKALRKEIDIHEKILITMEDLKQDTGIIKFQKEPTYYEVLELIRLCIVESDNTAYLKLVGMVGKDKLKEYGNSLGAIHTMEGKETDSFGLINCKDMIIYWKKVKAFIDSNNEYSALFKEYLLNPSVKLIEDASLNNKPFVRKYGSWDIAYHEAGYVNDEYYLIVLTQINKMDYKEEFINETAKRIDNLNNILKEQN